MSTPTATGLDARQWLSAWMGVVTDMTTKDIKAIPDDRWLEPFGGCTRSCNQLLADTVSLIRWTTAAMEGGDSDAYGNMANLAGEMSDKASAIGIFKSSSDAFIAAMNACSDERLQEAIPAPWQMPTPLFMICHIAVSHVWYHDGQFNYVQCLLGDDKVHWMEE